MKRFGFCRPAAALILLYLGIDRLAGPVIRALRGQFGGSDDVLRLLCGAGCLLMAAGLLLRQRRPSVVGAALYAARELFAVGNYFCWHPPQWLFDSARYWRRAGPMLLLGAAAVLVVLLFCSKRRSAPLGIAAGTATLLGNVLLSALDWHQPTTDPRELARYLIPAAAFVLAGFALKGNPPPQDDPNP